jgi:hypothetical protein
VLLRSSALVVSYNLATTSAGLPPDVLTASLFCSAVARARASRDCREVSAVISVTQAKTASGRVVEQIIDSHPWTGLCSKR